MEDVSDLSDIGWVIKPIPNMTKSSHKSSTENLTEVTVEIHWLYNFFLSLIHFRPTAFQHWYWIIGSSMDRGGGQYFENILHVSASPLVVHWWSRKL